MRIKVLFVLSVCIFFCRCSNNTSTLGYVRFFTNPDNGLVKENNANNINYKVQLKDAKFITIQQLGLNNLSKNIFDSMINKRKNYYEFMFRIWSDTTGDFPFFKFITKDEQELFELNQFFMLNNSQFSLLIDSQAFTPVTYFFTPNSGAVPYEECTIGYIIPQLSENNFKSIQFIYDDRIYKKGSIYFTFTKKSIIDIPSLQL
jgi:hypothetical protein